MMIYKTRKALFVESENRWYTVEEIQWDEFFNLENLRNTIEGSLGGRGDLRLSPCGEPSAGELTAPLEGQEIWAAGVTYYRSRDARMEESQKAGGGSFYDRVYDAERPELFYKGSGRTAVGHGEAVRLRGDSKWNVPEPELTLAINSRGRIFGFTIGNDMSSRDIEGQNPLYLPQAKVYDGSAALGPGVLLTDGLPPETEIQLTIERGGGEAFSGTTAIREIKRPLDSLVEFLFRDNTFPRGCFLMTGTGIVPPNDFTLQSGDAIGITIQPIGTLTNTVS